MTPSIRSAFNEAFTKEKYEAFLEDLQSAHPGDIVFRVAETPLFIDKTFTAKILEACESIVDVITQPGFHTSTDAAIPPGAKVPGSSPHTDFIAFDFGICINESGEYLPQLIEMQGFPSLFAYQILCDEITRKHFDIPAKYDSYLGGFNKESYIRLLKEIILNRHATEHVILLEIFPDEQKTRIDFRCTQDYVGIKTVCLTKLIAKGKKLYYNNYGETIEIKRIYNRIIFDELDKYDLPGGTVDIRQDYDVEWCPHPDWFYRISKYNLPSIQSRYVPETRFLNQLESIPADLENYVLKPLFSFAGQGVIIDLTKEDIDKVTDPENWILQRKVQYADVIQTPDVPAKAEIRIFYFWPKGASRPLPTQNLARLSKGKMIGVRYNADKEWVGGSVCFFEQE